MFCIAMTKEKVLDSLKGLPDEFELEDLFERLLFINRIEEGLRQSAAGEIVSEEEARRYLSRWQFPAASDEQS